MSFAEILQPALETLAAQRRTQLRSRAGSQFIGSSIAGAEFGGILAFLSANVLGQFDPFSYGEGDSAERGGQLLLVAPNILNVARQLHVDLDDFRIWVCLHEQTHRVQFAAAGWLAQHLREKIYQLTTSQSSATRQLLSQLPEVLKDFREQRKEWRADATSPKPQLTHLLQSPENRKLFSDITAVMSLLEGHANVVMDAVGTDIIPSVETIRARFESRSQQHSPLQKLLRKLLQMERKSAQYRDGQRFVSGVVEAVGMERFNRIWEAPEHLPSEAEIHDPLAWVKRMGYDVDASTASR